MLDDRPFCANRSSRVDFDAFEPLTNAVMEWGLVRLPTRTVGEQTTLVCDKAARQDQAITYDD